MKRQYMTPTVLVEKLQQRCQILAGSNYVQGLSNPSEEGFTFVKDGIDDDEDM